jgi:sec-independent protein translocase protein TatC
VTFQLPVVLSILARVGIVNARQLRDMRRYAIVALVALAAVFTPPDPYSMVSLAVPLIALYEISIVCVGLIQKSKARADAERAAAEGA